MSTTYADKPWLKQYDPGVSHTLEVPRQTIHHYLEEAARKKPDNTALVFRGRNITYRELNGYADAIAAGLIANGFQKGHRAVVYMANTPQLVMTYYGILKAGGIVIATNPLYTERELEHQLADCGAETVFVMSRFYNLLKKVQRGGHTQMKRIIVTNVKEYLPTHLRILYGLTREKKSGDRVTLEAGDMAFQDFMALGAHQHNLDNINLDVARADRGMGFEPDEDKPYVDVKPDDVALLQYTGGTTGLSKGAIALHRNLVANCAMVGRWVTDWEYGRETILGAIPFFHSYGMVAAMLFSASIAGRLIIVADPRNQEDVLGSINKYKPAYFPGVPAMYVAINNNPDVAAGKYDVKSIRACISGSAPLLQDTKKRFEELTGGKLVEGYGLTEAHVASHANPINGKNPKGSIGLPLPGVEVKLMDPTDPDIEMPVGELGEIAIKSPTIMQGYWNMSDDGTLRDGWLYTGDIARMDEDGFFYIEDRKKDLIICGGYNVYPREVEEVLARFPDIQEVCVAGVPDPRRGETVKAWVVLKPGSTATEQEIMEWSKDQLAKYKYPRMIEFRGELPKTIVGKVLKRELVKEHKEKEVASG